MKTYTGARLDDATMVEVNDAPLAPCGHLMGLDPAPAFEWGYQGSGPEHLALAILMDHLGDAVKARDLARSFRDAVIAMIQSDEWTIESRDVARAIKDIIDDQARQSDITQDHGIVHVDMTLDELLNKVRGIE